MLTIEILRPAQRVSGAYAIRMNWRARLPASMDACGLTSVTLAVCAVNYTLLMSALWVADLWTLPPMVLAWSGDVICAAGAVLFACAPRGPGATALPPPAPRARRPH